jgi:hypothetical protein
MRVIILMMEAASTSETMVNFYQTTWCNNPEDNHLHVQHSLTSLRTWSPTSSQQTPIVLNLVVDSCASTTCFICDNEFIMGTYIYKN